MKMRRLIVIASVAVASGFAQEEPKPPSNQPTRNFQVLKTRRIDLGNRSIILNRVVPPVLPEPPPPPPPPTAEEIAAAEAAVLEADLLHPPKKQEVLFLSTTVYDRRVTEVRWVGRHGEYKIFSNIDFNFLVGRGRFETTDTDYMLLMGIGNETAKEVEALNQHAREQGLPQQSLNEIPSLAQFSSLRAEYIVIEDEKHVAPSDEELIGLDALHIYYDANKQMLAEEYAKREAAEAERQQWLKDHPPVPKDIVINYWRKPSERPKAGGTQ